MEANPHPLGSRSLVPRPPTSSALARTALWASSWRLAPGGQAGPGSKGARDT